jgi:DNA modification methylase
MAKLNLEYCDPNSLRPFEANPRKISEKGLEKLQASVEHFGFTNPILAQKGTRTIIAGHQRLKAAMAAGLSEVPVIWLEFDDETAKAYNLADNRLNQESEWEFQALADLLSELDSGAFDITVTGFDENELEDLMTWTPQVNIDDIVDDEPPPAPLEPLSNPGELWLLGKHRLLCGDSTSKKDMEKLMGGALADLVVTDPPYNVDVTGGGKTKLKIKNDKQNDADFLKFLEMAFANMYQATSDGGSIYVFHADTEGINFRLAFKNAGFKLAQCCVWRKQSFVLGRQDYQWQHESVLYGLKPMENYDVEEIQKWYSDVCAMIAETDYEAEHEPVMYGWKPTAGHRWYSDRKQTTIWDFDKPFASKEHPTMKPVSLCAYPIGNSSKAGHIVLDPFGGSGSTLMACEQTDRVCYTMELDPTYCDVILARYVKFTNQQPVLESTGETWAERQDAADG